MSDWLSIIIVILIIGIVLDGIRRARNSRKNELRLSKNARKVDRLFEKEAAAELSSELPFGGARSREESEDQDQSSDPVQESLELEDPVPMLMDTVAQASKKKNELDEYSEGDEGYSENDIANEDRHIAEEKDEHVEPDEEELVFDERDNDHTGFEPQIGELDDLDSAVEPLQTPNSAASQPKTDDNRRRFFSSATKTRTDEQVNTESSEQTNQQAPAPEEILIVNVIAKAENTIPGQHLLDVLSSEKLKYGHMGIFHRHLNNDGDGPILYSIANIVEPGSFNFAQMKNSDTPGICIFLTLPTAGNAINAYDDMISTARSISARLACELSDENRNSLTKQAIEHGRQRVVEFERKNKLKNPSHL